MPVTGLDHYLIRTNDLERSKNFYVSVLGFQIMSRPDNEPRIELVSFDSANGFP